MIRLWNELILTGKAPRAKTPPTVKFVEDLLQDVADMREMAKRGGPDPTVEVVR